MSNINQEQLTKAIQAMSDTIIANEVYFCELDSAAGDGDFGMSLAKGFRQLQKQWNELEREDIGAFLKSCGMVITEHCGGASGPIWGSAFRGMGRYAQGKSQLGLQELGDMLHSAIEAIQKRGGAKLGDKTLLDALIPLTESIKESAEIGVPMNEALEKAILAAHEGAENTKKISATKGRASYVGERSINHPDAGAMAIAIISQEMKQALD